MTLRIATWNINSVRLRLDLVERLVARFDPDILCLQETKVQNQDFPRKQFRALGYEHAAINGQKGYHGVAILSRAPFRSVEAREWCGKGDARHVMAEIDGVELHNFYVPAGGDVPDPEANDKFAHKLDFLDEMTAHFSNGGQSRRQIVLGDLNIAPLETDVWSHKQLLDVVSHTPIEVDKLNGLRAAGGWRDVMREFVPPEERLYTWWSYRARDYLASNRGRRLDHVWAGAEVGVSAMTVVDEARGWERPSDHVPVIVDVEG